jgi:hypothetical protein
VFPKRFHRRAPSLFNWEWPQCGQLTFSIANVKYYGWKLWCILVVHWLRYPFIDYRRITTNHFSLVLKMWADDDWVKQLQRNKWVRQPKNGLCTRVTQPTNELCARAIKSKNEWCTRARHPKLCTGLRLLLREDLHIGVRQRPLNNLCVGVR